MGNQPFHANLFESSDNSTQADSELGGVYCNDGLLLFFQLLKTWGAEVTAVCSTKAVDMLRGLGADHVIDYTTKDLKASLRPLRGYGTFYS